MNVGTKPHTSPAADRLYFSIKHDLVEVDPLPKGFKVGVWTPRNLRNNRVHPEGNAPRGTTHALGGRSYLLSSFRAADAITTRRVRIPQEKPPRIHIDPPTRKGQVTLKIPPIRIITNPAEPTASAQVANLTIFSIKHDWFEFKNLFDKAL